MATKMNTRLTALMRIMRLWLLSSRRLYCTHVLGMDIHPTASFSLSARLDTSHPRGIHIGEESYVAFEAAILSHDMTRGLRTDTWIGKRCFIGGRSIILPGVRIGDQCIIGAGSVVTRDVPSNSVAAGNPAKVIKSGIELARGGCLPNAGYLAEDPYGYFSQSKDV